MTNTTALKQTPDVNTPSGHLPCLTALRGIAALWVMMFHIEVVIFHRDLGSLIAPESTGLLTKGYLAVDFFFILSGFIMAHVYASVLRTGHFRREFGRYIWARFSRIYPLHLFTLIVAIAGSMIAISLFPHIRDGSWDTFFAWQAIPSNLLLTHAMNQHVYLSWNMASWSIGAEWWTYILATPLIILISEKRPLLLICFATLALVALALIARELGNNSLDITFDYGFFRCYPEFVLGLCLYAAYTQLTTKLSQAKLASLWLSTLPFFALVLVVYFSHFNVHDLFFIPVFMLLIIFAALNRGTFSALLESKPLVYIGNISYAIYLVHSLFFLVFWFLLPELNLRLYDGQLDLSTKMLYVISFIGLTWLFSDLSYRFIELPSRRSLRRLRLRRQEEQLPKSMKGEME